MKKIQNLILISILILNSCKDNINSTQLQVSTQVEMNQYDSDSLHISIQYPKNWSIGSNQNSPNTIVFSEPLQNNTDTYEENLKLWVEEIPFEMPDSIYYQAAITQIKLANDSLEIENLGLEKIGQTIYSHFQFEFTTSDNNQYMVHGYTYLKGKYAYNFTFTTEKHVIANYNSTLHSILETFKSKV